MKYYLAAVAVPDDYKPDGEIINDVDFYFSEGHGHSAVEYTKMVEIRKENFDKWLTFQQMT